MSASLAGILLFVPQIVSWLPIHIAPSFRASIATLGDSISECSQVIVIRK